MTTIALNATPVDVIAKKDEPLRMTQAFAHLTMPSGEKIEVITGLGNPLLVILRGEKLTGTLDFTRVIQEAAVHVARENAS